MLQSTIFNQRTISKQHKTKRSKFECSRLTSLSGLSTRLAKKLAILVNYQSADNVTTLIKSRKLHQLQTLKQNLQF